MNIRAINLESSSETGHKLLQTKISLLAYMLTKSPSYLQLILSILVITTTLSGESPF